MLFNNEGGNQRVFHHGERRRKLFTFFDVADAARESAHDRIAGNAIKNDALDEITRALSRACFCQCIELTAAVPHRVADIDNADSAT